MGEGINLDVGKGTREGAAGHEPPSPALLYVAPNLLSVRLPDLGSGTPPALWVTFERDVARDAARPPGTPPGPPARLCTRLTPAVYWQIRTSLDELDGQIESGEKPMGRNERVEMERRVGEVQEYVREVGWTLAECRVAAEREEGEGNRHARGPAPVADLATVKRLMGCGSGSGREGGSRARWNAAMGKFLTE